jgi:anti-anti-sigma factor
MGRDDEGCSVDDRQLLEVDRGPAEPLEIQVHDGAAGTSLVLSGDLDRSGAHVLLHLIDTLAAPAGEVVIDGRQVRFLDAGGLRALVQVHEQLAASGVALVILACPMMRRLARLARVDLLDLR